MRYAQIRKMDISNGEGVGISLFVQGCHFHCKGCFNSNTWNFNGGQKWTEEIEDEFLKLAAKPYIKRISILGGEPLADENLDGVLKLINKIRFLFPQKTIWLYSGYTWGQIMHPIITDDFNHKREELLQKRRDIVLQCNILVDGQFIENKKDLTLNFRGSTNQRVIDIKKSLEQNKIVLWCD